jgi:glyoxylase-like metal-dependent hydrolase (beta-lactamase superfamily II)
MKFSHLTASQIGNCLIGSERQWFCNYSILFAYLREADCWEVNVRTSAKIVSTSSRSVAVEQGPHVTGVSNCGFVRTTDGVIVIDCLMTPCMTRSACKLAEVDYGNEVRHVLLTHGHIDHVGGGSIYRRGHVWSTTETIEQVKDLKEHLPMCIEWMPDWVDELRLLSLRIPKPVGELSWLWSEASPIELIDFGRAHSPSDVAYVVDSDTLFAGDLAFFQVTPLLLPGGSIRGWIEALRRINELSVATIVPGHGPIGNKHSIRNLKKYLEYLLDHTERSVEKGYSALEAVRTLQIPNDCWSWAERQRSVVNLFSAYKEVFDNVVPRTGEASRQVLSELRQFLQVVSSLGISL